MNILRRFGIVVTGLVLVVGGLAVGITSTGTIDVPFTQVLGAQPGSFGWNAYAPLTKTTFVPYGPNPTDLLAFAAFAVGLILIAGWVGFRLGRRAPTPK